MKKAEATRLEILRKAFELIYVKGYQASSIDDILAKTQVTKGAFYYHFKNKEQMGMAIINDLLKPTFASAFIQPFMDEPDPLIAIYNIIHYLLMEDEFMKMEYGCPVSNLTQELSPWHADFNHALAGLVREWETAMINSLEKGKKAGFVRKDARAKEVALFVMSGYWGVRNVGKLEMDKGVYRSFLKALKGYLNGLK
ncbi:TetR/AcrR family transcriptional regulator [Chitinophaga sp. Cy-1792]|uniref:TetR/AcrR family transcriptional regulator n=1 Tax=Chitinophaga sp. Cy-1792 TaxID=2608339 RepID=UPI00141F4D5F|nr:TetR/AcrR family transcriptional regulator [Chitinophaga sp. Cy-1792]NIG54804.1 TetR/AcrR family transcriptional regulator [Chitinophaga sp. Cy-1792]